MENARSALSVKMRPGSPTLERLCATAEAAHLHVFDRVILERRSGARDVADHFAEPDYPVREPAVADLGDASVDIGSRLDRFVPPTLVRAVVRIRILRGHRAPFLGQHGTRPRWTRP